MASSLSSTIRSSCEEVMVYASFLEDRLFNLLLFDCPVGVYANFSWLHFFVYAGNVL